MQSFPKTKLIPPAPPHALIERRELAIWLRQAVEEHPLVLLSAAAGYGKTTLLSALPRLLPEYRLAWLALDPDDNDPVRFLAAFAAALEGVAPRMVALVGSQSDGLASVVGGGSNAPAMRALMTQVINQLMEPPAEPFILVLDDLHCITGPVIYAALDHFIEHLPRTARVVVAARREPGLTLHRLRARRQVAELNGPDLRFNREESQQFLNGLLHLGLSQGELASLQAKTEGWPVGLVLLTNRLRRLATAEQRAELLARLDRIDPVTYTYLAEEVLAEQTEDVRDFLLHSSILAELTPQACRQLTGCADAGSLLEKLYRRNLFLTKVAGQTTREAPVYRYHALFAEFMQCALRQQAPAAFRALHGRAAEVVHDPGRVIHHLLQAEEWARAAGAVEASGEAYLQAGLQETVSGWIAALPEAIVAGRGRLAYLLGLSNLLKGDLPTAQASLERALTGAEADPDARGSILVALASLAFIRGEFERSLALVARAEPSIAALTDQVELLMLRASLALFCQSDLAGAGRDLRQAVELVTASDNPRLWFLLSLYLGPEFTVLPGALDLLEGFAQASRRHWEGQICPLRLGINDTLASIHLRRGRVDAAAQAGKDALWVKEQLGGYPFLGMNAAHTVADVAMIHGDYAAAGAYLARFAAQAGETGLNRALAGGGLYAQARLAWLQGRGEQAAQIYRQMLVRRSQLPRDAVLERLLAGLLELSGGRHAAARAALSEAARLQERERVSEIYGAAQLFLGAVYLAWEKPHEALNQLEAVLVRCEAEAAPGVILQAAPLVTPLLKLAVQKGVRPAQASVLLAQLGVGALGGAGALPGLLTARQVEILRLIADGYSNQAVAEALFLSLATVKSHVVHIMDRLDASSRLEAVARARQRGIL